MARRAEITATAIRGDTARALVTLFEPGTGENEGQEVPVGEWEISFPVDSTMPDILQKVDEARSNIEKAADTAGELRRRINAELARAE